VELRARELKTVQDSTDMPLLEVVKEAGVLVIYEADNMDRQISVPVSAIPALIRYLEELK
jgi:hypothetical protein